MPAHKSALKRIRQADKNNLRNVSAKSALKTLRKNLSKENFPILQSALDKAAKRGIIHFRKAARLKSRLVHQLQSAGAASPKA